MSDYIKINIDDYKPHPMNSNTHPQEQITELGNSLERFGQYKNVVVWNEYIIAGHGVVETARLNGLTELEAKDYSHLSQEDAVALMESDNQTPKLSIIDPVKQAEALASLSANPPGFDDLAMAEAKAALERRADELVGDVDSIDDVMPPDDFKEYDDDIDTQYCCPKCGYEWSGKPK